MTRPSKLKQPKAGPPASPSTIAKTISDTGFPFQMAVADFVTRTKSRHQCEVLFTEHSWVDHGGGTSGFIDLVVANGRQPYVFVVECKRKQGKWYFLKAVGTTAVRRHAKLFAREIVRPEGRMGRAAWVNAPLEPDSVESSFCVVQGADKDSPMLERIAATLVQATEALATEDDMRLLATNQDVCYYASVIVTNVPLVVAEFLPGDVDLETGRLVDGANVNEYQVPYLRFRKQVSFLKPNDDRKVFENNEYDLDYLRSEQYSLCKRRI